jgi:7,8-dihydropterin-6-yl-methyl-4-(beta-D-ribofuranosyl)aminobenzene 5'-phosphate synthase
LNREEERTRRRMQNQPCKVTFLVEDTVHCAGLLAEHGLAVLIEWERSHILFDTGQTDLLLSNAKKMSIDLSRVSKVAISHGHYDHTGGLLPFLRHAPEATIFAHPDTLHPKFVREDDGTFREVGIPFARKEIEELCSGLRLETSPQEIVPGVILSGEIPRKSSFEEEQPDFFMAKGGDKEPDAVLDDQALIVDVPSGLVVLLGCAHAGVINTLHHVRQMFPRRRISVLAGGMHLASAPSERVLRTVEGMKEFDIQRIIGGHCTGRKPICSLSGAFDERFSRLSVGTVIGEQ